MSRPLKAILVVLVLAAAPASAGPLRFERLSENRFVVEHNSWGANGEVSDYQGALKRAASICRAAGYEFVEVLGRSRTESGFSEAVEFTVHHETGKDRMNCAAQADTKFFEQAKKKLAEMEAKKKK
jgi:hypothetical protein